MIQSTCAVGIIAWLSELYQDQESAARLDIVRGLVRNAVNASGVDGESINSCLICGDHSHDSIRNESLMTYFEEFVALSTLEACPNLNEAIHRAALTCAALGSNVIILYVGLHCVHAIVIGRDRVCINYNANLHMSGVGAGHRRWLAKHGDMKLDVLIANCCRVEDRIMLTEAKQQITDKCGGSVETVVIGDNNNPAQGSIWHHLSDMIARDAPSLAGKTCLLYSIDSRGLTTMQSVKFGSGEALSALQGTLHPCLAVQTQSAVPEPQTTVTDPDGDSDVGLPLMDTPTSTAGKTMASAAGGMRRSETQVWASGKPNIKVVVTGVSAALPGRGGQAFTPGVDNIRRIIDGESFISAVPDAVKDAMLEKHVVVQQRQSDGTMKGVPVKDYSETINVCASLGAVDLGCYGIAESIVATMDRAVQVSVAAGLEALRDAGLVTGEGPGTAGWELPPHMQSTTGVVYATSFPALDTAIVEVSQFFRSQSLGGVKAAALVQEMRRRLTAGLAGAALSEQTEAALHQLQALLTDPSTNDVTAPYAFDRKFLFRVLVLGNAQLAQIIKARGPNMQTNAACAGATQAIALAYDLIQVGRAERVVVIAGDNASSDNLMPWLGNGFRILGAASIAADVSEAARPFSAGRSGMILGAGGIGMVLESEDGARRRHAASSVTVCPSHTELPARPPFKCRLLGTLLSNSAYHGAAMDRAHIAEEMERFLAGVQAEHGISREEIARHGVYFSHETGTHASPASSCAANEIYGLRKAFGSHLSELLILNTKGFTGHPMGVSFEDVVAVEVLRTGRVPPIANFSAVDPHLGTDLKLSKGGMHPCKYAIRFAAGFGSQIALALYGIA